MAAGIDAIASAFSIVSLAFQLFEGCVEGYKLCKTAQHIGDDADLLNTKLAVQCIKLEGWAIRAGLKRSRTNAGQHKPNERLDWQAIVLILGQQQRLLSSARDLSRKYQLVDEREYVQVEESPSAIEDSTGGELVQSAEESEIALRLRSTFMSLRARRQARTEEIGQNNSILNKLKWAVGDKDKFARIVADIAGLNDELMHFLHEHDQAEYARVLNLVCRLLVNQCKGPEEVENLRQAIPDATTSSVLAAAEVKEMRLTFGLDKQSDEMAPRAMKYLEDKDFYHYTADRLLPGRQAQQQGMSIMPYKHQVVMVEWRAITENYEQMRLNLRSLAKLLSKAKDSTFHSLQCTGYVAQPDQNSYGQGTFGFVYDVSKLAIGADASSLQSRTLLELVEDRACRYVSISNRIRIACKMAEAVMQLHTAGWLHKGIRSENVRFVAAARADPSALVAGSPYLVGHGYARPDNADAAVLTEMPDSTVNRDVYRHPSARGHNRLAFQKHFDMYGLACILVEMAFWKPLKEILQEYTTGTDMPSLNVLFGDPIFQTKLSYHVGPSYIAAIQLCFARPYENVEADADASTLKEMEVLNKLNLCRG